MKNVVVTFEGNKDGRKVLKYWNAIECLDSSIIIDLKQFQKKLRFIFVEKVHLLALMCLGGGGDD